MAIQVKDDWKRITVNKGTTLDMYKSQMLVYKAFRYGETDFLKDKFAPLATNAVLITLGLIPATSIAAAVISALVALGGPSDNINATITFRGTALIEELEAYLNKSTAFAALDVTVFTREFYNTATGVRFRVIYGNSAQVGGNKEAYKINRVQNTNGTWVTPTQ